MQAELDEMSGILHCEENDNLTAYSYFLEAHEAYEQVNDPRSLEALTYMCLCKVCDEHLNALSYIILDFVGFSCGRAQHYLGEVWREACGQA